MVYALAALIALPALAFARGNCNDIPMELIVAPQTAGQGGISGDGLSIYNNPNDPVFNGGTLYQDGVGGVYIRFQICNGTNDFIINLRGSKPVRYLSLDFSLQLAPADTAEGAIDLTGQKIQQQGEQINEMANAALYSNGQFLTCSGMMLNPLSSTVTGGKPEGTIAPGWPAASTRCRSATKSSSSIARLRSLAPLHLHGLLFYLHWSNRVLRRRAYEARAFVIQSCIDDSSPVARHAGRMWRFGHHQYTNQNAA
jgi:hypothetical protein